MELSRIVFWSAKHHRHFRKQMKVSYEIKHTLTILFSISTTGCLLKTFMRMFLAAIFIIVRIWKETQMSINWWMGIQIVVHPCNAILLCNINEWTVDVHSMTESQKHYVNRKVPYKKTVFCKIPFIWNSGKGTVFMIIHRSLVTRG